MEKSHLLLLDEKFEMLLSIQILKMMIPHFSKD